VIRNCADCEHPTTSSKDRPDGVRRACGRLCMACWTRRYRTIPGHLPIGRLRGGEVDQVVVERLKAGTLTGLPNSAELRQAVLDLRRDGVSIRDTAVRLGCSSRTVIRHRAAGRDLEGRSA
jgi:hypothetical protein